MAFVDSHSFMLKAYEDLKENRLEACYTKILTLIEDMPEEPFLLYMLGSYYSKLEQCGMSLMAYEKAISLRENFSEAINNVSGSYRKLGMQDKAIAGFSEAVKIGQHPDFAKTNPEKPDKLLADYLSNLGSTYVGMNNAELAIKYLNEALEVYPECHNARWNRSLVYLEVGRYKEGFEDYEFGDRMNAKRHRNYRVDSDVTPMWDGSADKVVAVYGEQGIGDELMFATMIEDLAKDCKEVIYDAHPRLYKMFRRAFAHLGNVYAYGTRKSHDLAWCHRHQVDCKSPIGSLAKFYRHKWEDFPRTPYLEPSEKAAKAVEHRFAKLPKRPNIGISWRGGTRGSHKSARQIPEAEIRKLVTSLDANIISLQYDKTSRRDVDLINEGLPEHYIYHWQKEIDDYELTAAMLPHLDLIISVPQSVVHLAGVMGARTYQLCPYNHLWQMGKYGEDMPWYNCVTNFWQKEPEGWTHIIDEAIKQAKEEFQC